MKRLMLSVLLVIALSIFVFALPVAMAQGPENNVEPDMQVWINEEGGAKICSGPLFCFNTEGVDSVLSKFQTGILMPDFMPLYQTALDFRVSDLVVMKQGQEISIGINGKTSVRIRVEEQAYERLVGYYLDSVTEQLMPWLLKGDFAVSLHFSQESNLALERAPVTSFPVNNLIKADVTVDSQGRVIGVAGLEPSELGLTEMRLNGSAMDLINGLGVEKIDLQVQGNRVVLVVNGSQWVEAAFDADQLLELGSEYVQDYEQIVVLGRSWLEDSEISFSLVVSDEPSADAPVVQLTRPIRALYNAQGLLSIEGLETGVQLPEAAIKLLGNGVYLVADGPSNQVRSSGDIEVLLDYDAGFFGALSNAYLNTGIDAEWIDGLIANLTIGIFVGPEGEPPESPAFVERRESQVVLSIPVSIGSDQSIALWGEKLPLEQLGIAIELGQYKALLEPIQSISVGAESVALNVRGTEVSLRLLGKTRMGLVEGAIRHYDLPLPGLLSQVVEKLLGLPGPMMIQFSLDFRDEPLPSGTLVELFDFVFP